MPTSDRKKSRPSPLPMILRTIAEAFALPEIPFKFKFPRLGSKRPVASKKIRKPKPKVSSARGMAQDNKVWIGAALCLAGLYLGWRVQMEVVLSPLAPSLKLWGFYFLAAAIFTAGVSFFGKKEAAPGSLSPKVECATFGLLMILAAFFRIYKIGSIPSGMFIDQGMEGWSALRILHEGFRPVWEFDVFQNPALLLHQLAVWFFLVPASQGTFYLFFALMSLATLPLIYWTFRQIAGPRTALLGLFILAIMRWNINFSRNGFPTLEVPFYSFGTLAFLTYALQSSKKTAFFPKAALAVVSFFVIGMLPFLSLAFYSVLSPMRVTGAVVLVLLLAVLGCLILLVLRAKDKVPFYSAAAAAVFFAGGLYTYQAYKIVPGLVLLFALYEILLDRKAVLARWAPILVFSALFLVLATPYLIHTYQGAGLGREESLSILAKVQQQHSWRPLLDNVARTAEMFHWRGDGNGRHNLQDFRMLDDVTGVLFLFGILGAMVALRTRAAFYGLVGFLVMCVPCLLSIDAAHANRMLGTTPYIALLAALPLAAFWEFLRGSFGRKGDLIAPALFLVTLLYAGWMNFDAYFHKQANNVTSWQEYAPQETSVGWAIQKGGEGYDYFLSPRFYNYYSISFLGYGHMDHVKPLLFPGAIIPSQPSATRGLYFALEDGRTGVLDYLKELYPGGRSDLQVNPAGNTTVLYYWVEPAELKKALGLKATFDREVGGTREKQLTQSFADLPPGPYHATLTGNLYVEDAWKYTYKISGNCQAELFLKGLPVPVSGLFLERGFHPVKIELNVPAGTTPVLKVEVSHEGGIPKGVDYGAFNSLPAPRGLKGQYYRDPQMTGEPFLTEWDPILNYTNGNDFSAVAPYYCHWSGSILIPQSGKYEFSIRCDNPVGLKIDGLDWIGATGKKEKSGDLAKGWHKIDVYDLKNAAYWPVYSLNWTRPDGVKEVVPNSAFGLVP